MARNLLKIRTKSLGFWKTFFKNSKFDFFSNKPLIFFDSTIGKGPNFSKMCHLLKLRHVFMPKFNLKVIATLLEQVGSLKNSRKNLLKTYINPVSQNLWIHTFQPAP